MPDQQFGLNSAHHLAIDRTMMAAERTLMAWVRTSLSLISFGFTIAKFFQYLNQQLPSDSRFRVHTPRYFGLALTLLGLGALVVAIVEHDSVVRRLRATDTAVGRRMSSATLTAMILFVIGVLMMLNLALRIW